MNFTSPFTLRFFTTPTQFGQPRPATLPLLREARDAYEDAVGDFAVAMARMALQQGNMALDSPWTIAASHAEPGAAAAQPSPAIEQFRGALARRDELARHVELLQARVEQERQAIEDENLDFGWHFEPDGHAVPEEFSDFEGCSCGDVPEILPDGHMI